MDIVCCAVTIHDANFLLSLKPDHVRQIHASFLVNLYRFSRYLEAAVAKPLRNKNDHVTECAATSRHVFFVYSGPGMRLGASRIRGHTNAVGLRRLTLDPDPAGYRTSRVGVGCGQTQTQCGQIPRLASSPQKPSIKLKYRTLRRMIIPSCGHSYTHS